MTTNSLMDLALTHVYLGGFYKCLVFMEKSTKVHLILCKYKGRLYTDFRRKIRNDCLYLSLGSALVTKSINFS